ncbi:MAG: ABC transporter substrate-binding protein [Muribaculaceae bacterium]|nr:ABC transporter substrate-binding protein [Muribaculaceae bacterium]
MKNLILICISFLLLLPSCGNKSKNDNQSNCDSILQYAKGLQIIESDNYTQVTINNPWKKGAILQNYILIDRNSPSPKNIPEGTIIKVPLTKVLVYSSVHASAIREICGNYNSIAGICDAQYFNIADISSRLANKSITDCGSSMSPSLEKIINLQPDAIILSPFQNAGYGALTSTGIPIIECADYMENSPLGRAEWIKLFGLLYGKTNIADSIFNATAHEYISLKESISIDEKRPKIITENVINGTWYVPGGDSYMANLIDDAAGEYPWKDDKSTGSLQLDFTQVFDKAHDADIWLLKTFGTEITRTYLEESFPLNAKMNAFKNNGIYACDTKSTTLFEDFPFHPQILLKEYISIFHPNALTNYKPKYYKQITK